MPERDVSDCPSTERRRRNEFGYVRWLCRPGRLAGFPLWVTPPGRRREEKKKYIIINCSLTNKETCASHIGMQVGRQVYLYLGIERGVCGGTHGERYRGATALTRRIVGRAPCPALGQRGKVRRAKVRCRYRGNWRGKNGFRRAVVPGGRVNVYNIMCFNNIILGVCVCVCDDRNNNNNRPPPIYVPTCVACSVRPHGRARVTYKDNHLFGPFSYIDLRRRRKNKTDYH